MNQGQLWTSIALFLSAFSIVWGVNSGSVFEAQGTTVTFTSENAPVSFYSNPFLTSFIEGDMIDYSMWSFNITYQDTTNENVTYADLSGYLSFSIAEYTSLTTTDSHIDISLITDFGTFYDTVSITVDSADPCIMDPWMCDNYSIQVFQMPTRTTYFAGEELDLTGLEIDLRNDDVTEQILNYNDPNLSFESNFSPIINDDFIVVGNETIDVYFYDGFSSASTSFIITIYPETFYSYNFIQSSPLLTSNTLNSSSRSLETFGLYQDDFLIQGSTTTDSSIQMTMGSFEEGLIFEDDMSESFEVSILSQHLWGIHGMAGDGGFHFYTENPIIQNVYIQANASSGTQAYVEIKVNGMTIVAPQLLPDYVDVNEWNIFSIVNPLDGVGHLEIKLTHSGGGSIQFHQLRVESTNDPSLFPNLSGMLIFADELEELDSCIDQSLFINQYEWDYNSYNGDPTLSNLMSSLLLIDRDVSAGPQDELRVTITNKWNMINTQFQNHFAPPSERNMLTSWIQVSSPYLALVFFFLFIFQFYLKFKL
jgi:hypothetical protein